MARPFSSADAKRLIDEHNRIKSQLSAAGLSAEQYRSEILTSSEALVAQEVLSVLKDIPIEEINRDKKEFRVKALREYGYSSIADISTASVYTIASVHGISEDTAYSIKRIVGDIVSKARQGVKIKLSTDSKTSAATKLVTSISKYNRALLLTENCRQILNTNSRRIDYALVIFRHQQMGSNGFLHRVQTNKKQPTHLISSDSYYHLNMASHQRKRWLLLMLLTEVQTLKRGKTFPITPFAFSIF